MVNWIVLTRVTNADAIIHRKTDDGHDDTEESEEDPIFPDFGERVPPDEGDNTEESGRPLATVDAQLFDALFLFFLAPLLEFAQFGRLFLGVFSQTPCVAAIHLRTSPTSRTDDKK